MWRLTALFTVFLTAMIGSATATAQDVSTEPGLQLRNLTELTSEEIQEQLSKNWQQYDKQLRAVLKARFPEEKNFVSQLTLMVQEEKLPKKLIDSAWLWVRSKRPNTPYPFVYFERVIRLQAARAKFAIPAFDRSIYSERLSERNRRNLNRR